MQLQSRWCCWVAWFRCTQFLLLGREFSTRSNNINLLTTWMYSTRSSRHPTSAMTSQKNQFWIVLGYFQRMCMEEWLVHLWAMFLPSWTLRGATGALSTWPSSCVNALHLDTCEADSNLRDGDSRPLGGFLCPTAEVSLRVIQVIVSICMCIMYTQWLHLDGWRKTVTKRNINNNNNNSNSNSFRSRIRHWHIPWAGHLCCGIHARWTGLSISLRGGSRCFVEGRIHRNTSLHQ